MRYIIGIDLGTTNSCLSYVDTQNPKLSIQQFLIPQHITPDTVEFKPMLPSFCYLPTEHEGAFKLPWKKQLSPYIVGLFAQSHGAKIPTRLVQSAKSWLCHSSTDRREKILPFESADRSIRISPIEATARYLMHLREAWNHVMSKGNPDYELEQQEVILTVPASFDEVARALTAEAAKLAGFKNMTFLEEPQAAFYCWIAQHEGTWQQTLKAGDCILVCDVGGGTTDFSLIDVKEGGGKITFQRMAVGDHLLLGGDNIDVAIADFLEKKLHSGNNQELNSLQWLQLIAQARLAKESLLKTDFTAPSSFKVYLQGTGASVIQGSLTTEISKDELQKLLLEGFFGNYSWEDAIKLKRSGGFRTMGLPYEEEPSITKHLAHFLHQAREIEPKSPDFVLFNGGTMKPELFQHAIVESLKNWFPGKSPKILPSSSLDLAVGYGAAYYGKVRQNLGGIKIGGGSPRSYYLGLNSKALTLLPRGTEEGASYEPQETFYVLPNTPVAFHLYTSHVRLHDVQGELIEIDTEKMHLLPPIHTLLRYGKKQQHEAQKEKIPVHLKVSLTAIGTLELWLESQNSEHRWALEFQVRTASGQDNSLATVDKQRQDQTFEAQDLQQAQSIIEDCFKKQSFKPNTVISKLEETLQQNKLEWPPSVLRNLWEPLLQVASLRKQAPDFEVRWWNLVGFILRPGYGYPLDDVRVKDLWKIILGDLKATKSSEQQIQQWICFRRIAGGLNKGQQMQLAHDLLQEMTNKRTGKVELRNKNEEYQYAEKVRAFAALELIDQNLKSKVGNILVERIASGKALPAEYWALGRIGARHLIHGSAVHAVSKETCQKWVSSLMQAKALDLNQSYFMMAQLARKTDNREINLPQTTIDQILAKFDSHPEKERLKSLLENEMPLTQNEQSYLFGEQLPIGISLE